MTTGLKRCFIPRSIFNKNLILTIIGKIIPICVMETIVNVFTYKLSAIPALPLVFTTPVVNGTSQCSINKGVDMPLIGRKLYVFICRRGYFRWQILFGGSPSFFKFIVPRSKSGQVIQKTCVGNTRYSFPICVANFKKSTPRLDNTCKFWPAGRLVSRTVPGEIFSPTVNTCFSCIPKAINGAFGSCFADANLHNIFISRH